MTDTLEPFFESSRIDTTYFTRFERVAKVTRTDRGILAEVDAELLRVDVIRDDIVRLKISRGGSFDEQPTFAVCADLLADAPNFTVEGIVNLTISGTLWYHRSHDNTIILSHLQGVSFPCRDYQSRGLALVSLLAQLSRRGRTAGSARDRTHV